MSDRITWVLLIGCLLLVAGLFGLMATDLSCAATKAEPLTTPTVVSDDIEFSANGEVVARIPPGALALCTDDELRDVAACFSYGMVASRTGSYNDEVWARYLQLLPERFHVKGQDVAELSTILTNSRNRVLPDGVSLEEWREAEKRFMRDYVLEHPERDVWQGDTQTWDQIVMHYVELERTGR